MGYGRGGGKGGKGAPKISIPSVFHESLDFQRIRVLPKSGDFKVFVSLNNYCVAIYD